MTQSGHSHSRVVGTTGVTGWASPERAAVKDADQLLTNGLLVGFAPATKRNCRHVPTPRTLKGAGPCDVGCRPIRYHTTTNAARPAILGGLGQFQLTFASASWRWLGHHRCRREPPSRMSALGH